MTERESDAVFWDRLHGMPNWEAEQECVMRRERLALENAMLNVEKVKSRRPLERDQLGAAILENNSQLTTLNERIKYLRKLQDRIQWKETVRELFGDEAVTQCKVHMEMQWAEVFSKRREWSKG
jgi:hypothetical protein